VICWRRGSESNRRIKVLQTLAYLKLTGLFSAFRTKHNGFRVRFGANPLPQPLRLNRRPADYELTLGRSTASSGLCLHPTAKSCGRQITTKYPRDERRCYQGWLPRGGPPQCRSWRQIAAVQKVDVGTVYRLATREPAGERAPELFSSPTAVSGGMSGSSTVPSPVLRRPRIMAPPGYRNFTTQRPPSGWRVIRQQLKFGVR